MLAFQVRNCLCAVTPLRENPVQRRNAVAPKPLCTSLRRNAEAYGIRFRLLHCPCRLSRTGHRSTSGAAPVLKYHPSSTAHSLSRPGSDLFLGVSVQPGNPHWRPAVPLLWKHPRPRTASGPSTFGSQSQVWQWLAWVCLASKPGRPLPRDGSQCQGTPVWHALWAELKKEFCSWHWTYSSGWKQ